MNRDKTQFRDFEVYHISADQYEMMYNSLKAEKIKRKFCLKLNLVSIDERYKDFLVCYNLISRMGYILFISI